MSFDPRAFRNALGLFVTGVTIVTTRSVQGALVGVTANSFNSVSLDPPLILWSLNRQSSSLLAFEGSGFFAVHILRLDQIDLSNRFARSGPDKFEGLSVGEGKGRVPVLQECAARLECRTYNRHPAGDHVIFIGEVLEFQADPAAEPLLYHGGRYAKLTDMSANQR
jgi:3-hydroxy-9,10-secoandrosta-1,3,5(10)-triene-9,17-dione monooxygenase reductase component